MDDVQERIAQVFELLDSSYDEELLLQQINMVVDIVKSADTDNEFPLDFTTHGDIQDLEKVRECLREFSDLKSDIEVVKTREEAKSIRQSLLEIHEELLAFPVDKRVHKEIRELAERIPTLPSKSATEEEAAKNKRIHEVQSDPPKCPKCRSKMNLRVGISSVTWGCSEFPKCFGFRRATKKQASYILGESKKKPAKPTKTTHSVSIKSETAASQLVNQYVALRAKKKEIEQEIDDIKDRVLSEIASVGGSFSSSEVRISCVSRPVYRFSDEYYDLGQRLKEQRRDEIKAGVAEIERYSEYLSVRFMD